MTTPIKPGVSTQWLTANTQEACRLCSATGSPAKHNPSCCRGAAWWRLLPSHTVHSDGMLLQEIQLFLQALAQGGLDVRIKMADIKGHQVPLGRLSSRRHSRCKGAQVVLLACTHTDRARASRLLRQSAASVGVWSCCKRPDSPLSSPCDALGSTVSHAGAARTTSDASPTHCQSP